MTSITPAPQVSCIIQIKNVVKPSDREAWLLLFKQCFNHVSAEPECAYFIIGEEEAGVFRWTEGWTKDKDWVNNVQLKKPYYEPFFKATAPLVIESETKVEFFTPLEDLSMIKVDLLSFPPKA
ncbi:uncharacterized protein K444DRAFT_609924 [Hyaloscypha bicolor E]|uniref:ABM domain-containing protein n=1 Tax=Hyaloscypha bicolor E TaxID=1095630 RepID=A0A2J6TK98_9HELO|nr:uncharacterized protein K444DRAFT_609924 [Hyaloscypha bicolor E]PMD63432.1 hypothetical protein K444DRAFT_609924 [Hyaloscypha bicolor E]